MSVVGKGLNMMALMKVKSMVKEIKKLGDTALMSDVAKIIKKWFPDLPVDLSLIDDKDPINSVMEQLPPEHQAVADMIFSTILS